MGSPVTRQRSRWCRHGDPTMQADTPVMNRSHPWRLAPVVIKRDGSGLLVLILSWSQWKMQTGWCW
ncbi:hypothetical protein F2Q68_00043427 [Brassica cretica]|uniref:Uncharacterized protein n=1 Tax=Brassica cretica TaxID=69181 RepID=A0A8S9LLE5_BRACR|nr:hypothetical protein F2Q68_00043427 [Brassica cretica]